MTIGQLRDRLAELDPEATIMIGYSPFGQTPTPTHAAELEQVYHEPALGIFVLRAGTESHSFDAMKRGAALRTGTA